MLTKRQKECWDVIAKYQKKNGGLSPSYEEIRELMGLSSTSGSHRYVGQLVSRNAAEFTAGVVRSIRLLPLNGAI